MRATDVERWFGDTFDTLHPLLQQLHRRGGTLSGTVAVHVSEGFGGRLGVALARRFNLPASSGTHAFRVRLFHDSDGLHWHRQFAGHAEMKSLFVAVGTRADGYWIEKVGPVRMALTVDVIDGGWHWRCLKTWVHGLRVPLCLLPRTTAFKRIEAGRYRFFVDLSLPLFGTVLSYGGLLDAAVAQPTLHDEAAASYKIK